MKKFLLSLLVIILALGLLGAAGVAGYRYGFTQGALAASVQSNNGNGNVQPWGPGFGLRQRGMPMHNFGFNRGFDRDGFGMMQRGRGFGFGFFPLFGLLAWLLLLGLIVAGILWLINRSGWRLTRAAPAATSPAATTVVETPPAAGSTSTVVETPPASPTDEENPVP